MDQSEKLNILDDVLRIKTVNGNEKAVADYLKELFEKHGIESEYDKVDENRFNLIASITKGNGKILGFTGHEDEDFHGNIKFIATVGEELGEIGSKQLAKEGFANDLDALIVGEPSNASSIETIHKLIQSGLLEVPQPNPTDYGRHSAFCAHKGSLDYDVISHGRSAHSSMPQLGINAIDNLVTFYNKEKEYFNKIIEYNDDILGNNSPSVTIFDAGDQRNTIPDIATLKGKIRTIPEYDNDKIIAGLQKIVDDLNSSDPKMNLELIIQSSNWPVKTTLDSEFLAEVRSAAKEVLNEDILLVGAPGGTDASQFFKENPNLHVVVLGPGNETAHQINEFMEEKDYFDFIEIYKLIAKNYLK
ncbi:M20/M25/M40 family metallo-hydrolase [Lactobacillus terrae]|uniref:M20/M25/M40 family metallo-hydrolase n=1 Tax=Lactobacillus terrae TaxID=2269374 RepID=UPI000C1B7333|nr:M20/M25/M40 family metallo-hydrolase [Lactobacillus terrae]